jgi:hypothetical protein
VRKGRVQDIGRHRDSIWEITPQDTEGNLALPEVKQRCKEVAASWRANYTQLQGEKNQGKNTLADTLGCPLSDDSKA